MKHLLYVFMSLFLLTEGCVPARMSRMHEAVLRVCGEMVPDQRTDRCVVEVSRATAGRGLVLRGEVLSPETREKVLSAARAISPACTDSLVLLPAPGVGEKCFGLVTVSVANLRARPGHGAEMVSQAVMGTPLRILKKERDWVYIQTPDRYLSWTNASSVQPVTPEELEGWRKAPRLIFTGQYGEVFADTLSLERISDLAAGCLVEGAHGQGAWSRVTLPGGKKGWARSGKLHDFAAWKEEVSATPASLTATARTFSGIPYQWGGTSSKALDCSGFTKTVWFLNGIILERDASQQFKYGEVVDGGAHQEHLLPGDLLFFGRKDPLRIIHVGIYLGQREVIHASGQVAIQSMDETQPHFSQYLSGTYVGARRVTGLTSRFGYTPVKEHPWY